MTNADVTRAANSAVDAASAGLEKYFQTMQDRVVSLLAEDRAHFTKTLEDVHTMLGAVATEQQEIHAEGKRDRTELLSGVHGLAQDLSMVAASVQEATARLGKLEAGHADVVARLDHKRDQIAAHERRLVTLETEALSLVNQRLAALEENNAQLAAIREELSALAARIGGALPTEADQDLSAQLRVDEAERGRA